METPIGSGPRITFAGGARAVTGSCFLLEAGGRRILVDCGVAQGDDGPPAAPLERLERLGVEPGRLDALVLTHAHLDHSGLLPLLVRRGFPGPVLATSATADLCGVLLPDSGRIQEEEAEEGRRPPLYTEAEARRALDRFEPLEYGDRKELGGGVSLELVDAGHILGSASAVFTLPLPGGEALRLAFSGDVGPKGQAIIRDPEPPEGVDVVVLESTYGDRSHPPQERLEGFRERVRQTLAAGGNVVVPAFAVGRTQELLYALNRLVEAGELRPKAVYVDSPMAISATELFRRHPECFDPPALRRLQEEDSPLEFEGLRFTRRVKESRAINEVEGGAVIIAAGGMAEGGRVLHHLKCNLPRERATVLFVGYQAQGTLGRRLLSKAREVEILGERIPVRARVEAVHGLSAHADREGLLQWASQAAGGRRGLAAFLVHGEQGPAQALARALEQEQGWRVRVPEAGEPVELAESRLQAVGVRGR